MADDDRSKWRAPEAGAWAAAAALFLAVGFLCHTRITDVDMWWHLATGDRILATGAVPRQEPFSYTAPGLPWIDIHWLFQVAVSWLHRAGGLDLLAAARTTLAIGLFGLLLLRARRPAGDVPGGGPVLAAGMLLLAALACHERFLLRPEMVSWILLAALMWALEGALAAPGRGGRRVRSWLVVPAIVALWANIQSLFMLAPTLLLLALVAAAVDWARAPRGRRDPDRPLDLLVGLALAAAATFLNPYGARALRLPLEQFLVQLGGTSLISRAIAEFQPTLSGYLVTPALVAFGVFVLLFGAALLADLRRVTLFEFLVGLALLYVALRARRNVPLFVVATAPILVRHAGQALAGWRAWAGRPRPVPGWLRPLGPLAVAAAGALVCAGAATNRLYLMQPAERWFGSGLIPHYFPEEAARFVAGSGYPGNVFHSLWAGGYLIHAWGGDRRVFIDGRNDPYLDDVLKAYLEATADPARFEAAARRYQITAVLWPHQRAREGRTLLSHLEGGGGWVRVHLDAAAAVYLRIDLAPALAPDILATGPGPEVNAALERALDESPFDGPPIREVAIAEYFSAIHDATGSEHFYRRALRALPENPPILHDCALALERQGKTAEARALYERALRVDPGFLPPMAALAALALAEGDLETARRHAQRAYEKGERGARLLGVRARLLEAEGSGDAAAAWQEALRRQPRNASLLREAAAFHLRAGRAEAAVPMYEAAASSDPDDPWIAAGLIDSLMRSGRTAAALTAARAAAGRALERLERRTRAAAGTSSALPPPVATDRDLVVHAARLERQAGDPARAAGWLDALARAGILPGGDAERDPDFGEISPGC